MKSLLILLVLFSVTWARPDQHQSVEDRFQWRQANEHDLQNLRLKAKTRNVGNIFDFKDVLAGYKSKVSPIRPNRQPRQQDAECGLENPPNDGGRVVSGQEASPNQFPWVVYMTCNDIFSGWSCTGSLIDPNWVLTAAHCVVGCSNFTVVAGGHDWSAPEESQVVIDSKVAMAHPNYDGFLLHNDVGLIELPEPAPLSDKIRTSCLISKEDAGSSLVGELTTVTGWGGTCDFCSAPNPTLHYAKDVPIMSNQECEQTYPGTILDSSVCIDTSGGPGVCFGDSGGPLNLQTTDPLRYVQVGVASFVHLFGCESGFPHGFARVGSFLGWIEENTGIQLQ